MRNNQITVVRLLSVPLENDYKHTLWFDNVSQQTSYFEGKVVHQVFEGGDEKKFSYQRKDGYIRYPADFEDIQDCNYIMYHNGVKWYYAFITEMQFKSPGVTHIFIETDVIQTWMFDENGNRCYSVKASFVEREHVDDDTIGANTIPENLEIGEYVCNKINYNKSLLQTGIILASTIDIRGIYAKPIPAAEGGYYGGVYSGLSYFLFQTPESLNKMLNLIAEKGQSDSIQSIFMTLTNGLTQEATTLTINDGEDNEEQITFYKITTSATPFTRSWSAWTTDVSPEKPYNNINGYSPNNNKLFTYPYCYLLANNAGGGSNIYKYEKFKNNPFDFKISFTITPGISCKMTPLNYGGVAENEPESLTLGKLPICAWTSDVYTNWLTQNSVNIALNIGTGVVQAAAGVGMAIATGGAGIAIGGAQAASGVSQIAGQLAQIHQHSLIPPAMEGNINSGDVNFADGKLTFSLCDMSIKKEYAEIIDGYFDMFGYKCNRLKVPNTNHRARYWYTKTIDCNIDGPIPMKDIQKIKKCYDNGVTFWKDINNIGDYSNTNPIV